VISEIALGLLKDTIINDTTRHVTQLWAAESAARQKALHDSDLPALRKLLVDFYARLEHSKTAYFKRLSSSLYHANQHSALLRVDLFQLSSGLFDCLVFNDTVKQQRSKCTSGKLSQTLDLYNLAELHQRQRLDAVKIECDTIQTNSLLGVGESIVTSCMESLSLLAKASAGLVFQGPHKSATRSSVQTLRDLPLAQIKLTLSELCEDKRKHLDRQRSRQIQRDLAQLFEMQNARLYEFGASLSSRVQTLPSAKNDAKAWSILLAADSPPKDTENSIISSVFSIASAQNTVDTSKHKHVIKLSSFSFLSSEFSRSLLQWRRSLLREQLENVFETSRLQMKSSLTELVEFYSRYPDVSVDLMQISTRDCCSRSKSKRSVQPTLQLQETRAYANTASLSASPDIENTLFIDRRSESKAVAPSPKATGFFYSHDQTGRKTSGNLEVSKAFSSWDYSSQSYNISSYDYSSQLNNRLTHLP
jgi:hypothetical protein